LVWRYGLEFAAASGGSRYRVNTVEDLKLEIGDLKAIYDL
jgi:hypothetical protein